MEMERVLIVIICLLIISAVVALSFWSVRSGRRSQNQEAAKLARELSDDAIGAADALAALNPTLNGPGKKKEKNH